MMKKYQPGPAKYTLPPTVGFDGHDIRKDRLPAYSLGLRLHNRHYNESPAPNTYALPSTLGGQDGVIITFPIYEMVFILFHINIVNFTIIIQLRPLKVHQPTRFIRN